MNDMASIRKMALLAASPALRAGALFAEEPVDAAFFSGGAAADAAASADEEDGAFDFAFFGGKEEF